MPTVTILIPTLLSRPELVDQVFAGLAEQTFSDFKVILVVNSSEVPLSKQIREAEIKLTTEFTGSNLGFTGAVNRGFELAEPSQYYVLLNDDAVPAKNWLEELVATAQESKADMVASKILLGDTNQIDSLGFDFYWRGKAPAVVSDSPAQPADQWQRHPEILGSHSQAYWQGPFGPDAAAALYSQQLIDQVGVLNPQFFAYLEDVELALRARQAGMRCVLAERAVVHHYKHQTSTTLGKTFKAQQDVKNWVRMWSVYPLAAKRKFGWQFWVERIRNLSGLVKALF